MKKKWMKVALPVAVLLVGVAGMSTIKASAGKQEDKKELDTRPTVKVQSLEAMDYQVTITGHGEVQPREKTQLSSQVAGEVVHWHPEFVPGGLIKRGTVLFSIEKDSYQAALFSAQANVSQAQSQLIEELARADVAKQEASKLPASKITDLYLRKPQVLSAKAAVKSAQAGLKIAERDLANCDVVAPYDALVISRDLGLGQFVQQGSRVAEIYNVESAEIIFPVAGFDSAFLPKQLKGALAEISSKGHNPIRRQGEIVRDLGVVDQATRMSQLVVSIDDPYGLNSNLPALKFGHYVEISFNGDILQHVYRLPQELVTKRTVWLVDGEQQLSPRKVEVLREEGEYFLISSGLQADDSVVLTLPEYPRVCRCIRSANSINTLSPT